MSFMDRLREASAGEDTEFEPIPEGTYVAKLADVDTEPHPDDGIMRTSFEFHITEGDFNGRRVWDKVKHSANVLWKACDIYNGMGIKGELDGWMDWATAVTEQCNRTFLITTQNREYEDKIYTGVKRLQPNDEVPF